MIWTCLWGTARLREIRDHGSGSQFPVEPRAGRSATTAKTTTQPADDHYLRRQSRQSQAADVEDGAIKRYLPSRQKRLRVHPAARSAAASVCLEQPEPASFGCPAFRMPGVGGGPSGLGAGFADIERCREVGPPNGPTVAPAQGAGRRARQRARRRCAGAFYAPAGRPVLMLAYPTVAPAARRWGTGCRLRPGQRNSADPPRQKFSGSMPGFLNAAQPCNEESGRVQQIDHHRLEERSNHGLCQAAYLPSKTATSANSFLRFTSSPLTVRNWASVHNRLACL